MTGETGKDKGNCSTEKDSKVSDTTGAKASPAHDAGKKNASADKPDQAKVEQKPANESHVDSTRVVKT